MFSADSSLLPYDKLLPAHEKTCSGTVGKAALYACCSLLNTKDLTLVTDGSPYQVAQGTFQAAECSNMQMRHTATNTLLDVTIVRSGPEHVTVIISPTHGSSGASGVTPTAQVLNINALIQVPQGPPGAVANMMIEQWTPLFVAQLRGGGGGTNSSASISVGGSSEARQQQEAQSLSGSHDNGSNSKKKDETTTSGGFGDVKPVPFDQFEREHASRAQAGAGRYGESDLIPGGGAPVGPGFSGQGGRGMLGSGGNYAGPNSSLFRPEFGGQVGTEFGRHDGPPHRGGMDPFSANPNPDHEPMQGIPRGPGGRPLGGSGGAAGFGNRPGNYFM